MPPSDDIGEASNRTLTDLESGKHCSNPGGNCDTQHEKSNLCPTTAVEITQNPAEPSQPKTQWQRVWRWVKGPQPPRLHVIVPLGGSFQLVPIKVLDSWLPRRSHRIYLLLAFYVLWLSCFIWVIHSATANGTDTEDSPVQMSCISRLWPSPEDCGLDGDLCRPFELGSITFRCPAYCRSTNILNPYAVGAEVINYRSLVIGGPTANGAEFANVYRGDSFICGAAIHAGYISDHTGGCGALSLVGKQRAFPSSNRNGIQSIGFNSSFPLSFSFYTKAGRNRSQCSDPQWRAFGVSVAFTAALSLFATSSALFFSTVFTGVFFQTALASDPPYSQVYDGVVSSAVGRFLPAAFVAILVYQYCVRYTLRKMKAQVEKTVLWLGACWVGAISNHTLDKIPISRLTSHDLKQQPGAITALVIILILLLVIVVAQAWAFRVEGRLPRLLTIYASLVVSILLFLAIPHLHLRIHHYVLALLLLPGTTLQTRPSLLYQGFLVGLFINGVARWGFESILQTSADLLADQQLGSLLPTVPVPIVNGNGNNITFSLALADGYNGISAVVNDVERFRKFDQENLTFTWARDDGDSVEYFRFGYVKYSRLGGVTVQDYTKAGLWAEDGRWVPMQPGPSK